MVITSFGQGGCPWLLLEIAWTQIAHTQREQASFLPNLSLSSAFPPCQVLPIERQPFSILLPLPQYGDGSRGEEGMVFKYPVPEISEKEEIYCRIAKLRKVEHSFEMIPGAL
jgi:hypothetical protein